MNELIEITEKDLQSFDKVSIDKIIEIVREKVGGIAPDLTTEEGRKEINRLSKKVAKTRNVIDSCSSKGTNY